MSRPVPFPKCWWVSDDLLAGPVFFGGSDLSLRENMEALESVGIWMVVSLVGFGEFYPDTEENELLQWEINERFSWYGFALPNGFAPRKETMQVMLGWIDVGLSLKRKVFVHCLSGRGRSGTVAGCWLARHGIASGQGVIDYLAERRQAAGLSLPCPETDAQRRLVSSWRKGQ